MAYSELVKSFERIRSYMREFYVYVREHMPDNVPSEIVIMTDGKSDFPEYEASSGIPVLWLLTNNRVRIPWGQAAYFRK